MAAGQQIMIVTHVQKVDKMRLYFRIKVRFSGALLASNRIILEKWSVDANLAIYPTKTKLMLVSTKQLSSAHSLKDVHLDLGDNHTVIERVSTTKLLGTHISQHLKWKDDVKSVSASC